MPSDVRRFDVLIASPGDAAPARDVVEKALHEWNDHRGGAEHIMLRPRRWEIASVPISGEDDGQSVINRQMVDGADIVFGLFYHRLGSATKRAISGTVEEIERSVAGGKPVHLYFSTKKLPYSADLEQFELLKEFRKKVQRTGLIGTFKSDKELYSLVPRAMEHDIAILKGKGLPRVERGALTSRARLSRRPASGSLVSPAAFYVSVDPQPVPQIVFTVYVRNASDSAVSNIELNMLSEWSGPKTYIGPKTLMPDEEGRYVNPPSSSLNPNAKVTIAWVDRLGPHFDTFRVMLRYT